MTTEEVIKPWHDGTGNILGDEVLRQISGSWTAEIWERFLTDTVDRSQPEKLISPKAYEAIIEEMIEPVWSDLNELDPLDTKERAQVRKCIRSCLTHQQQLIIRMIFWNEMSVREIAKALGVTNKQVTVQKDNSLRKLKRLLASYAAIFPCMKGKDDFSHSPETTILSALPPKSTSQNHVKGL